jgi:hypothetical protein
MGFDVSQRLAIGCLGLAAFGLLMALAVRRDYPILSALPGVARFVRQRDFWSVSPVAGVLAAIVCSTIWRRLRAAVRIPLGDCGRFVLGVQCHTTAAAAIASTSSGRHERILLSVFAWRRHGALR